MRGMGSPLIGPAALYYPQTAYKSRMGDCFFHVINLHDNKKYSFAFSIAYFQVIFHADITRKN